MRKPATPIAESEDALHIAVADYLRAAWPSHLMHWHTPLGGERPSVERIDRKTGKTYRFSPQAAKLKRMGAVAGIPDFCLLLPKGRVGFIELKTATGQLSTDQIEFRRVCVANGHGHEVCRSLEEVEATCVRWLQAFNLAPRARLTAGRAA